MTATVTRGSPASGNTGAGSAAAGSGVPGHRAARRRRPGFPRASTTPGKVRLIRAGLVAACLAWGALAALMVSQHASAAREATATSEPLSLAAQQLYQSLADADVTASTGYLYGRTPPFAYRQRYQRDIAAASADLKAVTAAGGGQAIGASLSTLAADLPVYTGYVEDGQTYNSLGYPAGGSFLEVASEEMHLTLRPAARDVYGYENARLTAASALFTRLEAGLDAAIRADQAVFADSAAAGSGSFTGLVAGVAVLALAMAAGCAWGLSRRLAEYR